MAVTPTTRWQVNGYRFLVRRMEHALVRRDVRMLHDPMRAQSQALAVGIVIASLGLAACAALALFRPQDRIGDASIVLAKESGAMYVVMGDTLRPVLNLASARLIVGQAANPVVVEESEIATRPRGALVGIPGAPPALSEQEQELDASWTVCDAIRQSEKSSITTSVVVGEVGRSGALGRDQALLVETMDETYLLHDGKRAAVDLDDPAITRALALEGLRPRPVSRGFVNAVPEVSPLTPPLIAGAGSRPLFTLQDKVVGSVFRVSIGVEPAYYVVLHAGIQKINTAVAKVLFLSNSHGEKDIPSITPDAIKAIPTVDEIPTASFPDTAPTILGVEDDPVICLSWSPPSGARTRDSSGPGAELSLLAGHSLPIPEQARTVTLAQADGAGDNVDSAYIQPGSTGFVQATGIEPRSTRRDSTFFVADTGVRFGIPDEDSAKALGLVGSAAPAPWQILGLLAPGPSLGRSSALVAHDGLAADTEPAPITPGSK